MALPVFVIGLALHNITLMVLIQAGTPMLAVRALQLWKEAYLGLLTLRLVLDVHASGGAASLHRRLTDWRSLPIGLRVLDVTALGFAVLLVIYALVPTDFLPAPAPTLAQRLLGFRTLMLIPALYLFGRTWPPLTAADRRFLVVGVVAAAAAVTVFGLVELWFIPSRVWLDWGIREFNAFQGFNYQGPGGLPSNFFMDTGAGLVLRRMVSTYLSPLGIAYTGLLVVPLALTFAVGSRRIRWPFVAFALVVTGIALSVTRLALVCLAVECIVLAVVMRRRWATYGAGFAIAAIAAALLVYPNFGPAVSRSLADRRPPLGAQILQQIGIVDLAPAAVAPGDLPGRILNRLATGNDPSIQAHLATVRRGVEFALSHPLGAGLGAAIPRFGTATGPGESALFQISAETGLLGFGLFLLLYGGLIVVCLAGAWRAQGDRALLPMLVGVGGLALAPVVLTSQVWGNLSVTFLFWWAAGAALTLMSRAEGHLDFPAPGPAGLLRGDRRLGRRTGPLDEGGSGPREIGPAVPTNETHPATP